MIALLGVISLLLAAIVMALSLAHALEYPGKRWLDRETYLAMQAVYYPGFTIGGAAEPLSIIAVLALLVMTPAGTLPFWLTLIALLALVAVQAVFWLVTQPVNKHWLKGTNLSGAGAAFFGKAPAAQEDWMGLRDRWEYSHIARSVLAVLAFLCLAAAVAL
jgi:Domain of unknown function (DUF1772)